MSQAARLFIAAALAAMAMFPAHAGKLVNNGSFEKPVVPDGGFQLINAGSQFGGWTVVGTGNIAIFSGEYAEGGFTFPAAKGAQWLDLTGNVNSASGIEQTIDTEPGTLYTLTFYVGNIHDPDGGLGTTSTVDVLIDGEAFASFTNKAGKGETSQKWKKFSTDFVAATSKTTITFMNGDAPDDAENGLDGVTAKPAGAP
jgi:hypothetical protein